MKILDKADINLILVLVFIAILANFSGLGWWVYVVALVVYICIRMWMIRDQIKLGISMTQDLAVLYKMSKKQKREAYRDVRADPAKEKEDAVIIDAEVVKEKKDAL